MPEDGPDAVESLTNMGNDVLSDKVQEAASEAGHIPESSEQPNSKRGDTLAPVFRNDSLFYEVIDRDSLPNYGPFNGPDSHGMHWSTVLKHK